MSAFDAIGVVLMLLHSTLVFLVVVSLPEAARRGNAAAGTIYAVVGLATVIWIWRVI